MNDQRAPWGPFDLASWSELAHVSERLPTETDVLVGRAVFRQSRPDEARRPADLRLPVGGNGVALLEELELDD